MEHTYAFNGYRASYVYRLINPERSPHLSEQIASRLPDGSVQGGVVRCSAGGEALLVRKVATNEEQVRTFLSGLFDKANTVKSRTCSLFRQGCFYSQSLPMMPGAQLRPLMELFGQPVLVDRPPLTAGARHPRTACSASPEHSLCEVGPGARAT